MNTEAWSLILLALGLGVGLAADACSVSMANGLKEPRMRIGKMCGIAGIFAAFQAFMPLFGWVCVHTMVQYFTAFEPMIPWIALALLSFIGGKMLYDGIAHKEDIEETPTLGIGALLIQGIATSIDALSVGFTISDYDLIQALFTALIIAVVTFILCLCGVWIGKKFGTRLSNKAQILGGAILIVVGINIFLNGIFG